MRSLLLILLFWMSFQGFAYGSEISADLLAALNHEGPPNEKYTASKIISNFNEEELVNELRSYLANSFASPASISIAAEVLVQMAERNEGDRGLIAITKSYQKALQKRGILRVIEKLSLGGAKQIPLAFSSLLPNDRKFLVHLMLDQASSSPESPIVSASTKLLLSGDAKLVLKSYANSTAGRDLAPRILVRLVEFQEAELGLARLAISSDLDASFSAAATKRVRDLLGGLSGPRTTFKNLDADEKYTLLEQILDLASDKDFQDVGFAASRLDRAGDLENMLRKYSKKAIGIKAAAEAIVELRQQNKKSSLGHRAIQELLDDPSPFVRMAAEEFLKNLRTEKFSEPPKKVAIALD